MEKRLARVNIGSAGGTAGKNAKTYKLTMPSTWVTALGITDDEREVELTLDGDRIVISKPLNAQQFEERCLAKGHRLMTFIYRDGQELCSRILADFTEHTVCVENFTSDLIKTAFGKNTLPAWDDLMSFLEERCIPRHRAGLREYLEALGLEEYDPLDIIRKTQGRMAEDEQWIEVLD